MNTTTSSARQSTAEETQGDSEQSRESISSSKTCAAEQETARITDKGWELEKAAPVIHSAPLNSTPSPSSSYAATREVDCFAAQIREKVVIEIGAGVGLLAMEMARFAKHVYAIEADPAWSWVFTECLYQKKPANLTWIFGTAESVARSIRGDVAVIYTRSAQAQMAVLARQMCPRLIFGPVLSIDELHPELPEDARTAAKQFAQTVTVADIISRRGVKLPDGI